jgi:uncharacterized membrane protein
MRNNIVLAVIAALMMLTGSAKADVIQDGKDFVNTVKPNVGYIYDFVNHEGVQFYSRNIIEKGAFSVPFGYTSTDGLAVGAAYKVGPVSPVLAVGMRDIRNIVEKPSSLTVDNFGVYAGINFKIEFGAAK